MLDPPPEGTERTYAGLTEYADKDAVHLGGNQLEGDPFSYSPGVWDYVITRFAVRSVLDVGSGIGYSADYFFRRGVRVIAIDGLHDNIRQAVYPTVKVDLTQTGVHCTVDLVHCQELVEHIEEKYLDNLLSTLANGRFLLMTHAIPGQPGHHHVNCQPSEYWISHMERYGFKCLIEDTQRIRKIARREGAFYLGQAGLMLSNPNR